MVIFTGTHLLRIAIITVASYPLIGNSGTNEVLTCLEDKKAARDSYPIVRMKKTEDKDSEAVLVVTKEAKTKIAHQRKPTLVFELSLGQKGNKDESDRLRWRFFLRQIYTVFILPVQVAYVQQRP